MPKKIPDDEFRKLEDYINEWADNRDVIICSLRKMADDLDCAQQNCNIATTVGSTVGVGTGVAAIFSVIMFPPAALGALCVGGAAAASNIVAGVWNVKNIKSACATTEDLFRHDEVLLNRIKEQLEVIESLDVDFNAGDLNSVTAGTAAACSKGVAGLGVRFLLTKTSGLSRNFLKGLSNAALGIGVALDAVTLHSTINDMKNGSKSEAAASLRKLANDAQCERERVLSAIRRNRPPKD